MQNEALGEQEQSRLCSRENIDQQDSNTNYADKRPQGKKLGWIIPNKNNSTGNKFYGRLCKTWLPWDKDNL